MKKKRTCFFAFLLMVSICLPSMVFIYYQARQAYVRFEMEEKLEKEKLQKIRIPAHKVVWYKKNKELIVEGNLFDVKEERLMRDGSIEFTGLFDFEETEIAKRLNDLQKNRGADPDNIAVKYASILLFLEQSPNIRLAHYNPPQILFNSFRETSQPSPDLPIPYPPPRA